MSVTPVVLTPDWPVPPRVRAAFTTRLGGVSAGPYASLNLGSHVGDAPAAVAANRAALSRALDLPSTPWWLEQVHGDEVIALDDPAPGRRGDAAITARAGVVAVVMVADCLPLLLCDRAGRQVVAVHGGWRGLAAGIVARAVAAFDAPPADLVAWLGPAIGPRAYVVGAELRARFLALDAAHARAFQEDDAGWHLDLAAIATTQLRAAGVTAVSHAARCVHDDAEHFFSYRRDGETGRMAALVWIEDRA